MEEKKYGEGRTGGLIPSILEYVRHATDIVPTGRRHFASPHLIKSGPGRTQQMPSKGNGHPARPEIIGAKFFS